MNLCAELQQIKNSIIDPVDKDRVEKFLKHVMIEDEAIYTLIGSKPMTSFSIFPVIDEEEKQVMYEVQTELFKKHISLSKLVG